MPNLDFELAEAPSPFIAGTDYQFAWDSTSFGLYKECPRKYYYTMIQGYRAPGESVHLTFGLNYHKALERYDIYRSQGKSPEDALDEVVLRLLLDTVDFNPDNTKKTRENLVRSVVWYLDEFGENDPAKTLILATGEPAVELSFKMELPLLAPNGENYLWCGHMDRMVTFADKLFVMDRKTTQTTPGAYYFDGYSPDNQMSGYILASQMVYSTPVAGVIIDAAQIAVGFTRFERGFTLRTPAQLEEWVEDTSVWLERAAQSAEKNQWPMNDKACHNYGGCVFRSVCSKDPRTRDNFLRNFDQKIWNPLEVR